MDIDLDVDTKADTYTSKDTNVGVDGGTGNRISYLQKKIILDVT